MRGWEEDEWGDRVTRQVGWRCTEGGSCCWIFCLGCMYRFTLKCFPTENGSFTQTWAVPPPHTHTHACSRRRWWRTCLFFSFVQEKGEEQWLNTDSYWSKKKLNSALLNPLAKWQTSGKAGAPFESAHRSSVFTFDYFILSFFRSFMVMVKTIPCYNTAAVAMNVDSIHHNVFYYEFWSDNEGVRGFFLM